MNPAPANFVQGLAASRTKLEDKWIDQFDDAREFNKSMPLFLYTRIQSAAPIVVKTERTIRADDRLAYLGESRGVVQNRTVAGIRSFRGGNLGVQFGGLVRTDYQIAAIHEFQLNLAARPGLNHFALTDRVAALNAAQISVGIARKRFTGNFSNTGDDFGHGTTPA